ncbi:SH3 domain-binding glutamic acid-rich-like protein 2 isoform X1 [Pogona vitticeps]
MSGRFEAFTNKASGIGDMMIVPFQERRMTRATRHQRVIKKRQQDIVRFLEANKIDFEEVDITMSEEQRLWMYKNISQDKLPAQGNPLPPQIFNDDQYCGESEP